MVDTFLIAYYDKIHEYAKFLTKGNEFDADDLTQETCLRALMKQDLFKQGSEFIPWVNKVMKNLYLNLKRFGNFEDIDENYYESLEEMKDLDKFIIEDIAARLSTKLRLCFLGVLEGYSYKEIATVLGIPEGTVKSRMNKVKTQVLGMKNKRKDN